MTPISPNKDRPGYKQTKVGWIPEEWECMPLGSVFDEGKNKGVANLPVLSVTMDKGIIRRSSIDRKMAPDLPPEQSLLVKIGDIAYNTMRMWQGAVGASKVRGVISPAYVVCCPKGHLVDSLFMFYYFKSHTGLHKLWAYSHGIAGDRLRLYFSDFAQVPAPLPPLPEQRKIADILATWDEGIERVGTLIEAKQAQKKGLMQQLLTGKKRLKGFRGEWKQHTLANISSRIRDVADNPDEYPVLSITAGKGFVAQQEKFSRVIAGKHIENYVLLRRGEFSYNKGNSFRYPQGCVYQLHEYEAGLVPDVFYSFRIAPDFADEGFVAQYFAAGLHGRQLYAWINTGVRNNGLLNLNATDFFQLLISLPPLPEQRAIAAVLRRGGRGNCGVGGAVGGVEGAEEGPDAEVVDGGSEGEHMNKETR